MKERKIVGIVLAISIGLFGLANYLYETRPKLQTYDEVVVKFKNASIDENYRNYIHRY